MRNQKLIFLNAKQFFMKLSMHKINRRGKTSEYKDQQWTFRTDRKSCHSQQTGMTAGEVRLDEKNNRASNMKKTTFKSEINSFSL
jgi:hypothetical protein